MDVASPTLRMLVMTNPAGMEEYFSAMAEPATSMELPAQGATYAMADPARAIEVGLRHERVIDESLPTDLAAAHAMILVERADASVSATSRALSSADQTRRRSPPKISARICT